MTTILITGGTGMIGKALTKVLLEKGYQLIILTRRKPRMHYGSRVRYALWDIDNQTIEIDAVTSADYIIHLAGANLAEKRWTERRKKEIVDSRVRSATLLVNTLKNNPNQAKLVVTASAIGWYGPDPVIPNPTPFTEKAPVFNDFLGQTCQQWENSVEPVTSLGIRLVKLRTGIVLSSNGGALKEFARPVKLGIAAIIGRGTQAISWIHIDDLVNLYLFAIENEKMNDVYNAVSTPVSNKEFMLELARIKRGKFFVPIHVPAPLLKIVLGEMSIEVLKSTTVSNAKIKEEGFSFQYSNLSSLHALFKKV